MHGSMNFELFAITDSEWQIILCYEENLCARIQNFVRKRFLINFYLLWYKINWTIKAPLYNVLNLKYAKLTMLVYAINFPQSECGIITLRLKADKVVTKTGWWIQRNSFTKFYFQQKISKVLWSAEIFRKRKVGINKWLLQLYGLTKLSHTPGS